jgi:hypothetical protein
MKKLYALSFLALVLLLSCTNPSSGSSSNTPATTYTALPASANGTWWLNGVSIFTITDGRMTSSTYSNVSITFDSSGNLFYGDSHTKLPDYTWDGSVIKFQGTALTKGSSTTNYTPLPASANGNWSVSGYTMVTIDKGIITLLGTTMGKGFYDSTGAIYYQVGSSTTSLARCSNLTWDGNVIKSGSTVLTKS